MSKELGKRLRAAREQLHMSQAALAEAIGAGNQSTVAGWERGRTEPDGETLARLAVILKVSTDHLLGLDSDVMSLPADVTDLAKDIASLSPADRAVIEKIVAALKAEDKDKVVPG
ncbi:helix-turn-helix transcriptional regulator [Sporomusa sp. KB1]|jgi:transcriptional regulator with XRE-family HTH domain|uniref:helix-turn-helix transcriptional regulator n=1 Tax=Sporomusa sp. KB1 TaxID=943346 RepID=UPI00119E079E|nr:helix-turn-helix transcriptional regulator [Sporomusa sp. KB1]TWH49571.1 putative transcriptional regulator [Sporomusa sp. KB1]